MPAGPRCPPFLAFPRGQLKAEPGVGPGAGELGDSGEVGESGELGESGEVGESVGAGRDEQ